MDAAEWLGLVAGAMTTAAFVPQAWKTLRTRSAADFSLPMLVLFVGGVALWTLYGVWNAVPSIVLANGVTLPLAGMILLVKLREGR
ncbi:MAG: SemiSWEET transporter [Acetobacteraceae bacterium]|nr:SemiSWEET transporter [Acetobacteraceae bacterium]